MVNRDYTIQQLTKLDGQMKKLHFAVKRQEPLKTFIDELKEAEDIIENLRSIINREPLSPNELNKQAR